MNKIKQFFINAIIGGLFIILPLVLIFVIFKWLFNLSVQYLKPVSELLTRNAPVSELMAYLLALLIILTVCFVIGMIVRTRIGHFTFITIERSLFQKIPGYGLIKDTLEQLLGNKNSPFAQVALVNIFGNDTLVTGFVTNEHVSGMVTVFVPTGPNPTSGNIYHVPPQLVHKIDAPVDVVMRSIIGCGTGSDLLIDQYLSHGQSEMISKKIKLPIDKKRKRT